MLVCLAMSQPMVSRTRVYPCVCVCVYRAILRIIDLANLERLYTPLRLSYLISNTAAITWGVEHQPHKCLLIYRTIISQLASNTLQVYLNI